jgi:hypothetical protein
MYRDRLPVTDDREPEPRRPPASPLSTPHAVLALQRTAGNAAVARAIATANAPAAAPAIDWEHIWEELLMAEDGMPTGNTLRLIGELGRAIPVLGAVTGAAADATGAWQDLYGPHWAYEAPWTHALVGIRGGLNGLNNLWGHVNYAAQLIQDLVVAGTGGTAAPATGTVNVCLSFAKGLADLGLATVDGTVVVMSMYNALKATPPTPGHPEFDAWMDLALGYSANMGGDVIGAFFDGLDGMTAGAAHTSTLKTAANWILEVYPLSRRVFDMIVGQLQGQLNLRGGDMAQGTVDATIWTLEKMREAHIVGRELIGRATGAAGELAVQAAAVGAALLDGKDPVTFIREQGATLACDIRTRLEALTGLEAGTANAAAGSAQVLTGVGDLRTALAQLQAEDLGPVRFAIDAATAMAGDVLATVEANATELGMIMELVAEQARVQRERLTGLLADIEDDLRDAGDLEELFERLIEDALAAAGIEAEVDLSVVSAAWEDAGVWIEQMLADFEARRAGEPSPGVDEAGIRNAPTLG